MRKIMTQSQMSSSDIKPDQYVAERDMKMGQPTCIFSELGFPLLSLIPSPGFYQVSTLLEPL